MGVAKGLIMAGKVSERVVSGKCHKMSAHGAVREKKRAMPAW
jgi:hypothetical protein